MDRKVAALQQFKKENEQEPNSFHLVPVLEVRFLEAPLKSLAIPPEVLDSESYGSGPRIKRISTFQRKKT